MTTAIRTQCTRGPASTLRYERNVVYDDVPLIAPGVELAQIAGRQLVHTVGDGLVGSGIEREEVRDNVVTVDGCSEDVPDDVGLGAAGDEIRWVEQNPRLRRLQLVRDLLEASFISKLLVGRRRQMRVFERIAIAMDTGDTSLVEPACYRRREYTRAVLQRIFHFAV